MAVTVRALAASGGPADFPEVAMVGRQRTADDAPVSATEHRMWAAGRSVVGIDEVGRGAWAGPVSVAAVILDPGRLPPGARDSKRLSPARREVVARGVRDVALVGIGHASSCEVDDVGLAAALTTAARRALAAVLVLDGAPSDPLVLVDGPYDLVREVDVEVTTMVHGDAGSISIAAASVVAKVERDGLMLAAHDDHPVYGFGRNRGYASAEHTAALERHGPCVLHRHSWAPIVRLRQPTLDV